MNFLRKQLNIAFNAPEMEYFQSDMSREATEEERESAFLVAKRYGACLLQHVSPGQRLPVSVAIVAAKYGVSFAGCVVKRMRHAQQVTKFADTEEIARNILEDRLSVYEVFVAVDSVYRRFYNDTESKNAFREIGEALRRVNDALCENHEVVLYANLTEEESERILAGF